MPDQEHTDLLINALLPFAQHMLANHGKFLPFGSIINAAGEVESLAMPDDEQPTPQELLEFMTEAARDMVEQGLCKAVGLCVAVQIQRPDDGEKMDAAMAMIEDATGAIRVFMPFSKNDDGTYEYGDLAAEQADPTVFDGDVE